MCGKRCVCSCHDISRPTCACSCASCCFPSSCVSRPLLIFAEVVQKKLFVCLFVVITVVVVVVSVAWVGVLSQQKLGDTPLSRAVTAGHRDIVTLLLAYGAEDTALVSSRHPMAPACLCAHGPRVPVWCKKPVWLTHRLEDSVAVASACRARSHPWACWQPDGGMPMFWSCCWTRDLLASTRRRCVYLYPHGCCSSCMERPLCYSVRDECNSETL